MRNFLFFVLALGLNAQIGGKIAKNAMVAPAPQISNTTSAPVLEGSNDPQLFVYNGSVHNCASQIVNVLLIGDSLAYGYGANIANTGGWAGRLTASLQKICPSHGTGIVPAYMPQWNQTVVATNNVAAQNGWSMVSGVGPFQSGNSAFGTLYQGGAGTSPATLSSQQGDTAIIYYATYSDSGAGFGVSFDGGSSTTYGAGTTSAYTAAKAAVAIPGGFGSHTVTITPPSTGHMYLYGVELTIGNVGISFHNEGRPWARADAFGADPANQNAFWPLIGGGVQLVIDSLGVNDLSSWNPAGYQTYQQSMIANWQSLNSPGPSVLILDQDHIQNENATNKLQLQRIELGLGASYLSIADRWGAWTVANALGLMFDAVHPNDKGYEDITAMLNGELADGVVEGASIPANATLQSLTVNGSADAVHVGSSGGTPMIAAGSALGSGTGAGVSVAGSDNNGMVVFNTGVNDVSSGTVGTIIFNQAWVNTSTSLVACVLQPANATAAAASANVYVSSVTTTIFSVTSSLPLKASSSYSYYYHCGN